MATQQQRREKGKRVCSRCRQCSYRAATAAGLTAATSTTTTMTSASAPALPAKRRRSHGRCETLKTRLGGGTREAGGLGEGRRRGATAAAAGEVEGEQRPNNSCRARNIQMELLDEQLTSLLELCEYMVYDFVCILWCITHCILSASARSPCRWCWCS
jgi:hypothetical protein